VPLLDNLEIVAVNTTVNGDLVTLYAAKDDVLSLYSAIVEESGVTFPNAKTDKPVQSLVKIERINRGPENCSADSAEIIELEPHEIAHPQVQVFSNGDIILVGSRANWTPDGGEHNAVIFDKNGKIIRSGCLGDGISQVKVDAYDRIWVGYFDEGVLGNYGWGEFDNSATEERTIRDEADAVSDAPIGEAGLVAFSHDLQKIWEWPDTELDARYQGVGVRTSILDVYALNVGPNELLISYYCDFPLFSINLSDREIGFPEFQFELSNGPKYLVGDDKYILRLGAYGDPTRAEVFARANGEMVKSGFLYFPEFEGKEMAHPKATSRFETNDFAISEENNVAEVETQNRLYILTSGDKLIFSYGSTRKQYTPAEVLKLIT